MPDNDPEDEEKENIWSEIARPFGVEVRYEKQDINDALGPSVARNIIMNHLYLEEDYILSTQAGVLFMLGWDSELLRSLDIAHAHGAHAVTQLPAMSARGLYNPSPPTFAAIQKWSTEPQNHTIPKLRARFCPSILQNPLDTLWIHPECLFFTAHHNHFSVPLPFTNGDRDPWFLTIQLWMQGVRAVTPRKSVVWRRRNTEKTRDFQPFNSFDLNGKQHYGATALVEDVQLFLLKGKELDPKDRAPRWLKELGTLKNLQTLLEKLGINLKTGTIESYARMGLQTKESSVMIIRKYGSLLDFRQAQEQLGLKF
jgi:hypothetical protein